MTSPDFAQVVWESALIIAPKVFARTSEANGFRLRHLDIVSLGSLLSTEF
jgi:hypothetical protein